MKGADLKTVLISAGLTAVTGRDLHSSTSLHIQSDKV